MIDRRVLLLALAGLPAGAARAQTPGASPSSSVIASFSILADLAANVAGPAVPVASLVGPNSDAHAYQPKPGDSRLLAAARLIVVNGLGFEGFIDRLVKASGSKAQIVVASKGIVPFIFALELLSQVLRLISLSVRLFANMLAGHLLIIMAAGFSILVGSLLGVLGIPFALFFYVFEWVLVAGLQAFIFSLLSGIYIGYAAMSEH